MPFTGSTVWPSTAAVTPDGIATFFLPIRETFRFHRGLGQKTLQRTSPPTFASRAAWSAMTPFDVERMVMPEAVGDRGMASTAA